VEPIEPHTPNPDLESYNPSYKAVQDSLFP
jgi:hypothetical protein